jgi:O-methyltransferase involved in polyketide biosynthesis
MKEKVKLTHEQATMLITLFSKARGTPPEVYDDPKAREILTGVDYDFSALHVPAKTNLTVCLRARKLDDYTRDFLAEHPAGRVLHLACGLDSRCERVAHPQADWYDLDLPEVIELRRKFYEEKPGYTMLAQSVTEHSWMERIQGDGRPTLVVAEGLLMYLAEAEVKALLLALQERFPGCRLVCDVFSMLVVRRIKRHPSIRATGATIQWGINDARLMEGWGKGIRLVEEWLFTQSEHIGKLGWWARFMFWVAGKFPIAVKAQRILNIELN